VLATAPVQGQPHAKRLRAANIDEGEAAAQPVGEADLHIGGERRPVLVRHVAELVILAAIDHDGLEDHLVVGAPVDRRGIAVGHAAGLVGCVGCHIG
jgi:hypothetical protein